MDEEVAYLLGEWGFSNLIEKFAEEQIDCTALRLLKDSELERMITLTGPRVKFRCHLEEWRARIISASSQQVLSSNAGGNIEDNSNESEGTSKDFELKNDELKFILFDKTPFKKPTETPTEVEAEESSVQVPSSSSVVLFREEIDHPASGPFDKKYVESVLLKSLDGQALLHCGRQTGGKLNDSQRRLLAKLLIGDILNQNSNKSLNQTEYTQLGLAINSLFPREPIALYYTISLQQTPYATKRLARGILYCAWVSRRRQLRNLGQVQFTPRRKSGSSTTSTPTLDEDSEVDHWSFDENLLVLRNTIEPWTLVETLWDHSTAIRLKLLEKKGGNLFDYFNEFPALKQAEGYQLLCKDFSYIFPGKENALTTSLLTLRDQLIRIETDKANITRDKDLKDTIRSYLSYITDEKPDSKSEVALLLLPYILTLQPCKRKSGSIAWKPSRSEIRDGFITQVATSNEVRPAVEVRRAKLARLGRTFQPLIIIVGETIKDYKVCHIAVDETIYSTHSLLKAVDITFKIFHATGAKYPEESMDVWLLIQRLIYKIETKFDRLNQCISSILAEFNLLK